MLFKKKTRRPFGAASLLHESYVDFHTPCCIDNLRRFLNARLIFNLPFPKLVLLTGLILFDSKGSYPLQNYPKKIFATTNNWKKTQEIIDAHWKSI